MLGAAEEETRLADRPATPPRRPQPESRNSNSAMASPPARLEPPVAGNWLSGSDPSNRAAMPDPALWDGRGVDRRTVAEVELERGLKKALKRQRDTEVKLQLERQKATETQGASARLLQVFRALACDFTSPFRENCL